MDLAEMLTVVKVKDGTYQDQGFLRSLVVKP